MDASSLMSGSLEVDRPPSRWSLPLSSSFSEDDDDDEEDALGERYEPRTEAAALFFVRRKEQRRRRRGGGGQSLAVEERRRGESESEERRMDVDDMMRLRVISMLSFCRVFFVFTRREKVVSLGFSKILSTIIILQIEQAADDFRTGAIIRGIANTTSAK